MPDQAIVAAQQVGHCRNCAREVSENAIACPGCGLAPTAGEKFCWQCGQPTQPGQIVCVKCGRSPFPTARADSKSKVAAGLLAIFLGSLGVHKFYLGFTKAGLIMLAVSVIGSFFTAGVATLATAVIGFIEGIIYLTKSDEEFNSTYVVRKKEWF